MSKISIKKVIQSTTNPQSKNSSAELSSVQCPLSHSESIIDSCQSDDSDATEISDNEELTSGPLDIVADMRGWARNNPSVPQPTLDSLLKVPRRHHPTLTRSSKTLLRRPTSYKYNIERLESVT
ncbi:hypothetical protein QAD02_001977 [Eretmocerus hayati]|uniref:Uncharacterized protein n=1 Tax=Eretmocerus hayati TaxID=131215 RepID=A0ACC2NHQ7_9HYME|nr:hypothetical protein QAD02_001977 [Eretmocerus hayati]